MIGLSREGPVYLVTVLDSKKLNLINYFECSPECLGLEIQKRKLEKSKAGIVLDPSQTLIKELTDKPIKIPNYYFAEYLTQRLYQEQGIDPKQWVMDFEKNLNKPGYLIYLAKRQEIKFLEKKIQDSFLDPVLAEPELVSQSRFDFFKNINIPERFYLSASVAMGIKKRIKI